VPFSVTTQPHLGGRWTSLRDPAGREWLWARPAPERNSVRPGQEFVDAGGVEECLPTISGHPDHGDLWTRSWTPDERGCVVTTPEFELRRSITAADRITVDYELRGRPGTGFIWALHALLRPDPGTWVEATPGPCRAWPDPARLVETRWPAVLGDERFPGLGPDDGTAMFALLPDRPSLTVRQGQARLRFQLRCPGQPVSFGLWRNLGGFPAETGSAYRSFGIEPMLGLVPDRARAEPAELARIPGSGQVRWQVVIDGG